MNKNEKDAFEFGYNEFRQVFLSKVRRVAKLRDGHVEALNQIIEELELETGDQVWRWTQDLCPGITWEQYEAEQEASNRNLSKLISRLREQPKLTTITEGRKLSHRQTKD